ncbi:hypothetical protein CLOM_g2305 [Closterium sp. NIES-68]|nr:hypothetical protein CLOM_g2305 [Closterium sp. NIES-68]
MSHPFSSNQSEALLSSRNGSPRFSGSATSARPGVRLAEGRSGISGLTSRLLGDLPQVSPQFPVLFLVGALLSLSWLAGRVRFGLLPVLLMFLFVYHEVSKRQRVREHKAARLAALQAVLQRQPMGDTETAHWLNALVQRAWPIFLERLLSTHLAPALAPWFFDKYRPWQARKAWLERLYLGSSPPVIAAVRVVHTNTLDDHVVMEAATEFVACGDMYALMGVKMRRRVALGMVARGHVSGLHLEGKMRVGMRFASEFPYVTRVRVSFVGAPFIGLTVRPTANLGFNLADLPFFSSWLDEMLATALESSMVSPNMLVLDVARLAHLFLAPSPTHPPSSSPPAAPAIPHSAHCAHCRHCSHCSQQASHTAGSAVPPAAGAAAAAAAAGAVPPSAAASSVPSAASTVPSTAASTYCCFHCPSTAASTVPSTAASSVPSTAASSVPSTAASSVPSTAASSVPSTAASSVPSAAEAAAAGHGSAPSSQTSSPVPPFPPAMLAAARAAGIARFIPSAAAGTGAVDGDSSAAHCNSHPAAPTAGPAAALITSSTPPPPMPAPSPAPPLSPHLTSPAHPAHPPPLPAADVLHVDSSCPVAFVVVEIIEARHLKPANLDGTSDAYVKCALGSARFTTRIVWSSLDPQWFAEFTAPVYSWHLNNLLVLRVLDKSFLRSKDLGYCVVDVGRYQKGGRREMWEGLRGVSRGRVRLAVTVISGEEASRFKREAEGQTPRGLREEEGAGLEVLHEHGAGENERQRGLRRRGRRRTEGGDSLDWEQDTRRKQDATREDGRGDVRVERVAEPVRVVGKGEAVLKSEIVDAAGVAPIGSARMEGCKGNAQVGGGSKQQPQQQPQQQQQQQQQQHQGNEEEGEATQATVEDASRRPRKWGEKGERRH